MEKNILVTGGCGFIGSHIVDQFVKDGHFVTIIDDLSAGTNLQYIQGYLDNKKVDFYQFDIRDFEKLLQLDREYSCIIHLAAQPDVKVSVNNPRLDFEINVDGSFNILELMRKKDIPRMIFASSGGTIYGETQKSNAENQPLKPISNYGAAKAAIEMYCSSYSSLYSMQITSIRLGNIFGPRSTHGVMYDFYNKLKQNPKELIILGNGKQTKTYLYISDTIEAFNLLLNYNNKNNFDVFNVSSSETISVTEIADELTKALGLTNVNYKYTGGERGWKGDVVFTSMDTNKIRSLGWSNKVTIKEGIKLYVEWLNEQKCLK
ncbi:MAG: SDR family NAD(P)-dependent oxidoreductase [Candidatus Heimdallarchaeum endolithica]|uniref:SDR family NAD(P)-dependent oxidoreductase n=1 Tax=Candidatus Heimdallarchaeum endolithica TaxID=2876572 RepID=A0A9Y1BNX4_9ARCH|nr:MAG: SDR family NAD(P)-dependent oxidoreductase [Candidatus Heimdallarchaeum endolithica]